MSKRKKIFLSISAAFLVLFIIVCVQNGIELFQSSYFYYRAYKDDRITINLTATIDGKPVKADDIEAKTAYLDGSKWDSVPVKDDVDSVTISVRAGGYGEYLVNTEIGSYHFVFRVMQWNWWDVQNINLYIDIDTEKNEYKTHEEYSYISEQEGYVVVYESRPETVNEVEEMNTLDVGTW